MHFIFTFYDNYYYTAKIQHILISLIELILSSDIDPAMEPSDGHHKTFSLW